MPLTAETVCSSYLVDPIRQRRSNRPMLSRIMIRRPTGCPVFRSPSRSRDDALFYAHYDILTQRPHLQEVQIDPISYYYIDVTGSSGTINNPALQPEKTIDYELGFPAEDQQFIFIETGRVLS
ncbi:MAG: TonB-dependent receptor [Sphingobacterium sp.]|nr:TonB-dependent receptor [Sphingobacterium sp.]